MRLPTVTPRQHENEDSRQRHERWYGAFLKGEKTAHPVPEGARVTIFEQALMGNASGFWAARGFRMRTAATEDRRSVLVWLERRQPAVVVAYRPATSVDMGGAWRQPGQSTLGQGSCGVARKSTMRELRADARAKAELRELENG